MKAIDPKFHIDGERIVKTSNGEAIPEDEPLMLFRGRDRLALEAIRFYLELSLRDGCTDFQVEGVRNRIEAFESFQVEHSERMKQPGITRGR